MSNSFKKHISKYGTGLASAEKFAMDIFADALSIPKGTIYAESLKILIQNCIEAGYKFGREDEKRNKNGERESSTRNL